CVRRGLEDIEKILAAHRSLKGQYRRRGDWPRWLRRKGSCLHYTAYERFCWTTGPRWLDRPRRLGGTAHRHDDPGEHTLPSFYGSGRSGTRDLDAAPSDRLIPTAESLTLQGLIGIGGASQLRPSHTTVRTGPYTAVREVALTRLEQGWETERFEVR